MALDAMTGEPVASFGENGQVDLRPGLGVPQELVPRIASQSPGVIFEDLIVMGSTTGEGYVAAPGHIRTFDVRSGEQARTANDKLFAFDADTGNRLWAGQLPAEGEGIPSVYEVDRRQYVVISVPCGGGSE